MSSRENHPDYRDRLYAKYGTIFHSAGTFDVAEASRWGKAYDYYLRGWMPEPQARIVDIACGSGRLLLFFKQRGYTSLLGVDISPDQVARAKQVVPTVVQSNAL